MAAAGKPRQPNRPATSHMDRLRNGIGKPLQSPTLDFYGLILVGAALIIVGMVMVLSSSSVLDIGDGGSGFGGMFRQLRMGIVGLVFLLIAAYLPPSFYKRSAWWVLGLGFLLQTLVLIMGVEVNGNRNWIRFGSLQMQPSEALKLALAVWMGAILAKKRSRLNQPLHIMIPVGVVSLIAFALVMLGNDLGTGLVIAALVAGGLWVAGVPKRYFVMLGGLGALGVVLLTVRSSNRTDRIKNWLSGYDCKDGTCLQPRHGLMGLAEGGWGGVGIGGSRQKWGLLPHPDNDYIFAIIGEEAGLLGTLGVVLLFVLFAWLLSRMIVRYQGDAFVQITVACVMSWIMAQALINMCVVAGVLPVIGVPMPFISAGGSALVMSMTALGMLLSFARHEPGAKAAIQQKWQGVGESISVVARRTPKGSAPAKPKRSWKFWRRRSANVATPQLQRKPRQAAKSPAKQKSRPRKAKR